MFVVLLMYLVLMYQKGRDQEGKKNLFSEAQPNLSCSDFHEEANIWYSSQAGLDSQPRWCKQKKGPKNSLVSPCREGTRKYGYFHMLRLPSKSLVESLRLSHKIGLKAIKRRRRGPTLHTTFFTHPNIYAVRYSFLKLHFGSLYHFHYSSVDSSFLKQCFFKKLFLKNKNFAFLFVILMKKYPAIPSY